ncbi:hypothetical protein RA26_14645 [Leisingera sp. ANG-M7]|nr:hypothetical protein RA26_14645 [Leisingera sp. ANG-M7]
MKTPFQFHSGREVVFQSFEAAWYVSCVGNWYGLHFLVPNEIDPRWIVTYAASFDTDPNVKSIITPFFVSDLGFSKEVWVGFDLAPVEDMRKTATF